MVFYSGFRVVLCRCRLGIVLDQPVGVDLGKCHFKKLFVKVAYVFYKPELQLKKDVG